MLNLDMSQEQLLELVDEETAVANINPNIYGNTSEYLSIIGLKKIAFSIDSIETR